MKERTMTIECSDCHNIYGLWRTQCPACGTANPQYQHHRADLRRQERCDRIELPVEKRRPRLECIACRRGGAKQSCPYCNEPIHKDCLALHGPECAAFQVTLREAYAKEGLTT